MNILIYILLFTLGLVIASFLNALIYRIDNKYKYPEIYIKRSNCEKCNKELQWYELIPILSYIIYRGKCSKCGYNIPIYYPYSELILGLGFFGIYYTDREWYWYVILIFLFILSYYDNKYKGIPKKLTHIFLILSLFILVLQTMITGTLLPNSILISTVLSLILFVISKLIRKTFGFGDILILFSLGFILSITQYTIFIYIFLLISGLYSILLVIFKKANLKSSISLLPLMLLSYVILIIFETRLIPIFNVIFRIGI